MLSCRTAVQCTMMGCTIGRSAVQYYARLAWSWIDLATVRRWEADNSDLLARRSRGLTGSSVELAWPLDRTAEVEKRSQWPRVVYGVWTPSPKEVAEFTGICTPCILDSLPKFVLWMEFQEFWWFRLIGLRHSLPGKLAARAWAQRWHSLLTIHRL